MTCQHTKIETRVWADTGAPCGLWACADCGIRFEPLSTQALTQAPQTKEEIADRLRWLSKHMIDIAASMDYYGGMSDWAVHGVQMAGAAHIANQWADEIEQEITT